MNAGPVPAMPDDPTPLDAALAYAARGWRVVPIAPGTKYPKGMDAWQRHATTDPEMIRSWWTGLYKDHGVGIATGPESGVWVLDIDDHDALHDIEATHGPLPDTLTSVTGSGGAHLFFAWDPAHEVRNNQSGKIAAGIDVRGDGGFVVAPPTVHPNGTRYEWDGFTDHLAPAEAPVWLYELLEPEVVEQAPSRPTPLAGAHDERPGDIWARSTSWADILTADGWTLAYTDRQGESHWVRPGKTAREGTSATTGYTDADTLKVFTSSMRHVGLEPDETYTKLGYLAAVHHGGDHRAAARELAAQGHKAPTVDLDELLAQHAEEVEAGAEPTNPLAKYIIDWPEFWAVDHNATEWVCEPLFAAGRAHALYAGAKTGKSFLVLAATAAMATGRPFLDKVSSEPLDTLYVDYEMTPDDLHDRLLEFGYGPEDDLSHLHYAMLPSLPPLDTEPGGLALTMAAMACGARFVVIDTTGRSTQGDENEASTFQDFYRHTGMRLKQAGIGWVRLDHAGKDAEKGQRGSSAKNDDVDIVVKLTRTDSGVNVKATHRRVGWYPESTTIDIGEDGHGVVTFSSVRGDDSRPYAHGTIDLVKHLDRLDVPIEMSKRAVRTILTAQQITASNAVLVDAIRFRRATAADLDGSLSPVDKSVDNAVDNARTTPRTTLRAEGVGPVHGPLKEIHTNKGRTTPRTAADHPSGGQTDHPVPLKEDRVGPAATADELKDLF